MADADVEVVIPSIKDEILTLESIPESVPSHVVREGTLNEARNDGVQQCDSELVAIMDDDITFTETLFWDLIDMADSHRLVGLADPEFGFVPGRVMIFHKSLWEEVGGFDERLRSHNGDTDFALRAHRHGFEIIRVPEHIVFHRDHERSITTFDRAWRLLYLCGKHPKFAPLLLSGTIHHNVQQLLGISDRVTVPDNDEWEVNAESPDLEADDGESQTGDERG